MYLQNSPKIGLSTICWASGLALGDQELVEVSSAINDSEIFILILSQKRGRG